VAGSISTPISGGNEIGVVSVRAKTTSFAGEDSRLAMNAYGPGTISFTTDSAGREWSFLDAVFDVGQNQYLM